MILSILIPSTYQRDHLLNSLLECLYKQIEDIYAEEYIEVLTEIDHGETPTGTKRNNLLDRAKGEWIVFIDSDDEVSDDYINEIILALKNNPDAVGFEGWMTTDGVDRKNWRISKNNPYCAAWENGEEIYLRYNNHISVTRKSIAQQIRFPNIYQGEDFEFAQNLHFSGLIKTEIYIHKFLYHYKYVTVKNC